MPTTPPPTKTMMRKMASKLANIIGSSGRSVVLLHQLP
jgi:hypothetical protein